MDFQRPVFEKNREEREGRRKGRREMYLETGRGA